MSSIKPVTYIDIHSHLYFEQYDEDREVVIKRMQEAGVVTAHIGTSAATSRQVIELAKSIGGPAVVGLHPADIANMHEEGRLEDEIAEIKELAADEHVKAVGECGFDFFHENSLGGLENKKLQEKVLIQHIELAEQLALPLMLHLRSSKDSTHSAYRAALDVLNSFPDIAINSHFFAGTKEEAKEILDRGGYVSFTGVITFAKEYEELVEYVPLEHIHAETDAPFVAPVPHRGKRNEPVFVTEVVKKISEIKKLPLETVQTQLLKNALKFFKVDL